MENKEERLMRLYERSQKDPSEIRRASKEISLVAKRYVSRIGNNQSARRTLQGSGEQVSRKR
jgi:hypothetical protein